jgi:signal peptide peptidase SppA
MSFFINLNGDFDQIPYAQEWLGPWAMLESHLDLMVRMAESIDINVHLANQAQAKAGSSGNGPTLMVSPEGIAIIPLMGTLQKQRASLSKSTSTVEARRLINQAANDPEVKGLMLMIESPGGTTAGTNELASAVAAAAAKKPTYSYIEDLGASAAYWVASQATKVFTNLTGQVGSIGTYMVVQDMRRVADAKGIVVHVVRAGEHKGTGTPGTEITAGQLAMLQEMVNAVNEPFIAAVARGRKLSVDTVRQLADGRTYVGPAALQNKLVDGVATAEDVIAELTRLTSAKSSNVKGSPRMEATTPKAASIAELTKALVGADDSFMLSQLKAEATLEQAKDAWMVEQGKRLVAAQAEAATAKTEADAKLAEANAKHSKPGNQPILANGKTTAKEDDADPVAKFNELVSQRMMASGASRQDAIKAVAKAEPAAHQAYLLAKNPNAKAKRQLAEKFSTAD